MKPKSFIAALFALVFLIGARCNPPGPPPDACGERRHLCADEAGDCCWDGETCCDVEGVPSCCAQPYIPPEPYYGDPKDVPPSKPKSRPREPSR